MAVACGAFVTLLLLSSVFLCPKLVTITMIIGYLLNTTTLFCLGLYMKWEIDDCDLDSAEFWKGSGKM
jgi:hypothetical protein